MQKLGLSQSLQQKLSPQQIQFIKLLQIPTAELESRVEEELEVNPALEEGREDTAQDEYGEDDYDYEESGQDEVEDLSVEDYIDPDDFAGYKMQGDGPGDEEEKEVPVSTSTTLTEKLIGQLGYLPLSERQYQLGEYLIGCIDNSGYIQRDLEAITNDLAFGQNIETSPEELEQVLKMIQHFDPPGIAARNLQECLTIQLERKLNGDRAVHLALDIIKYCYEEFIKKHYDKILRRLGIKDEAEFKRAIDLIGKLNPKPGETTEAYDEKTQYIIPDFILRNENGKLELNLNAKNAPELKISNSYKEMLETYEESQKKDKKTKEAATFVKQKLDSAKWFIDAIKQRQNTLLQTMSAIVRFQEEYFKTGDESKLKPMILKDIADEIGMDISTISRVANSKYVQTEFGVFPLKYFFSEGITTDTGTDVSSRQVKNELAYLIEQEDKAKPLSDDKLERMLKDKGYNIARRTVAKYREQLNLPVARLRKKLA